MEKEGRRPRKLVQKYRRSQRLLTVAAATAAAADDDDEKDYGDYYYYYYYHYHHRIFHFSDLAGKYSPILRCSNQQE